MFNKEDIRPGAVLSGADLRGADLRGSNLSGANLYFADLTGADLSGAILRDACLRFAVLTGSVLRGVILRETSLYRADLSYSDLTDADLTDADLTDADLTDADLRGANLVDTKGLPPMKCPEKGSYVGYKKAEIWENYRYTPVIVILEVTEEAKRSSGTTNKCRCSEAKVLSIESLDGSQKYEKAASYYCPSFVYEVGKTIKVDDFDNDRWAECAPGIHHFMKREEAEGFWF